MFFILYAATHKKKSNLLPGEDLTASAKGISLINDAWGLSTSGLGSAGKSSEGMIRCVYLLTGITLNIVFKKKKKFYISSISRDIKT